VSERPIFRSFFMGGFECSTHRRFDRQRLDLVRATRHDEFVAEDYRRLRSVGILTAREGLRWHLIERSPGTFDFSSALPMVRAARDEGIQLIWDLFHYGWPDDLDIFDPAFADRFGRLARAFAGLLREETDEPPIVVPVNEPSWLAWAGGDMARVGPWQTGRGPEIKRQMVRAALRAIDAVRAVDPRARILLVDPLINVRAEPDRPDLSESAAAHHASQFEAWDMIAGRRDPDLGGAPGYMDLIGVNHYPFNQWFHQSREIPVGDPAYRSLSLLLREIHDRYGRPIVVTETGREDDGRAGWLRHVAAEVRAASAEGIEMLGICLYPIVNHPGWDNDRHCHNGLWDYADDSGAREIHRPLADALADETATTARQTEASRFLTSEADTRSPLRA
jgi:beta-glucosidase/6-phospho-beta-glucosidase/beta-galactosidase